MNGQSIPSGLILMIFAFCPIKNSYLFSISPGSNDIIAFSLISVVTLVFASTALGFLLNQLWRAIYVLTFDFHRNLLPIQELPSRPLDLFETRWLTKSMRNELTLALLHRVDSGKVSSDAVSWHRNRIGDVYTNGTLLLSSVIGALIACMIIYLGKYPGLFHDNYAECIKERGALFVALGLQTASSMIIISRSQILLHYYNVALLIFLYMNERERAQSVKELIDGSRESL